MSEISRMQIRDLYIKVPLKLFQVDLIKTQYPFNNRIITFDEIHFIMKGISV